MPFIVNGNIDQFLAEMGRIPLLIRQLKKLRLELLYSAVNYQRRHNVNNGLANGPRTG